MHWNRTEEVNFHEIESQAIWRIWLSNISSEWGNAAYATQCKGLGGTHLHVGGALSHAKYTETVLLSALGYTGEWDGVPGIHSPGGGRGARHTRRIHTLVRWKRSDEVVWERVTGTVRRRCQRQTPYGFHPEDCRFPSSLFSLHVSVVLRALRKAE